MYADPLCDCHCDIDMHAKYIETDILTQVAYVVNGKI